MPLSDALKKYFNTPDNNFTPTLLEYLQTNDYLVEDYLLILRLTDKYISHLNKNSDAFSKALLEISITNSTHELLFHLIWSKLKNCDQSTNLQSSFSDYVSNNFPLLKLFNNYELVCSHEDTKNHGGIGFIIRWFKVISSGNENLFCEDCDSVLIPNFIRADEYLCMNESCSKYKVKTYSNHCWNCGSLIDSKYNAQCESCDWYICNDCGSCKQGEKGGCKNKKPKAIVNQVVIEDLRISATNNSIFKKVLNASLSANKSRQNRCSYGISTNRGTKILQNSDELLNYMCSYGELHYIKLISAFSKIDFSILGKDKVQVYDWGAGQAIGSIALLDFLFENENIIKIDEIKIIEPSMVAIEMAKNYLSPPFNVSVNCIVSEINKKFDDLNLTDIELNSMPCIHILSNIIDIPTFKLENFVQIFTKFRTRNNLFICIGPKYKRNVERTDFFYKAIKNIFSNITLIDASSRPVKVEVHSTLNNQNLNHVATNSSLIFTAN
ncbi:MAG: hypothetical protein H6609_17855 [Ignavibacteriales bacterium]|nr:hypothetical protein [Ignavibacteriales bacterium]